MITERTGRPVEIVGVTTLGDVNRAQMTQIGGTGVFVGALRDALLGGEVDLAVHSLKDLPAAPAAGIVLAAVPPRDDPRDALVARDGVKLADLPAGARIGTGSPRRAAQLRLLRADLRRVPIRGNAGTRLARSTRRRARRSGAGLRRAGPDRPAGRRHPGLRARRDAARARPGRAGGGMPRRGSRAGRAARRGERPGAAWPPRSPSAAVLAGPGGRAAARRSAAYAAGTEHAALRAVVRAPTARRVLRAHGDRPRPGCGRPARP